VFADEDQFWEYSKTSLRIWGTKATWPFESFEASCALNIGFVTGDNLEAIGGAVHVGRGKKKRRQGVAVSISLRTCQTGSVALKVASRIQTRKEHVSYRRSPLRLNHSTLLLLHPLLYTHLNGPHNTFTKTLG
jgi:hypothetical protein